MHICDLQRRSSQGKYEREWRNKARKERWPEENQILGEVSWKVASAWSPEELESVSYASESPEAKKLAVHMPGPVCHQSRPPWGDLNSQTLFSPPNHEQRRCSCWSLETKRLVAHKNGKKGSEGIWAEFQHYTQECTPLYHQFSYPPWSYPTSSLQLSFRWMWSNGGQESITFSPGLKPTVLADTVSTHCVLFNTWSPVRKDIPTWSVGSIPSLCEEQSVK